MENSITTDTTIEIKKWTEDFTGGINIRTSIRRELTKEERNLLQDAAEAFFEQVGPIILQS